MLNTDFCSDIQKGKTDPNELIHSMNARKNDKIINKIKLNCYVPNKEELPGFIVEPILEQITDPVFLSSTLNHKVIFMSGHVGENHWVAWVALLEKKIVSF